MWKHLSLHLYVPQIKNQQRAQKVVYPGYDKSASNMITIAVFPPASLTELKQKEA